MPPDHMIRRHIYDRNISIMADKTLLLKNADLLCTMGPRDAGSGQSAAMLGARVIIAALKSKMAACLPEMGSSKPLAIQIFTG